MSDGLFGYDLRKMPVMAKGVLGEANPAPPLAPASKELLDWMKKTKTSEASANPR